jgi:uncharacterized protein (TIGR00106 family)
MKIVWGKNSSHVIADVCITPIGAGVSVSKEIIEVEKVLRSFPVKCKLHAYGTNIEGEWNDVMNAVKASHARLHDLGVQRVSSNMRFGTRIDKMQSLEDKVEKVEAGLK